MANIGEVDFIEAGSGPPIVLVHSSVSGARQWRPLMETLAPRFHVRAPNLIGYGRTPAWPNERPQSLRSSRRNSATRRKSAATHRSRRLA